ncbi:hypothetical protein P170DRAFT_142 [Aspergillus steynii IBT 23096]|uniref:Uncharacterized protein n=1 Tax=Aspergillus steynii IBT 23096 TaxID=1392250 RepID=A0A2I2GL79_9EURO|nr:uncharacterized protein P170DRAFT_142 [Aspergillus steynii IBT 23096]PLB53607.1 hypothetical protein P170DRAFT_142 [Aspergillus steynii IBT 23096]
MAGKNTKTVVQWALTLSCWFIQFQKLGYINCLRCIIDFLLTLTPTLWSPREFLFFQSLTLREAPLLDDDTYQCWRLQDAAGRCQSWQQKREATSGPVSVVSGWYGPGAYLAWLLTAFMTAISAILGADCAPSRADAHRQDGELLLTLIYPLIAMADVVLRLARCQIDPGHAAVLAG